MEVMMNRRLLIVLISTLLLLMACSPKNEQVNPRQDINDKAQDDSQVSGDNEDDDRPNSISENTMLAKASVSTFLDGLKNLDLDRIEEVSLDSQKSELRFLYQRIKDLSDDDKSLVELALNAMSLEYLSADIRAEDGSASLLYRVTTKDLDKLYTDLLDKSLKAEQVTLTEESIVDLPEISRDLEIHLVKVPDLHNTSDALEDSQARWRIANSLNLIYELTGLSQTHPGSND